MPVVSNLPCRVCKRVVPFSYQFPDGDVQCDSCHVCIINRELEAHELEEHRGFKERKERKKPKFSCRPDYEFMAKRHRQYYGSP